MIVDLKKPMFGIKLYQASVVRSMQIDAQGNAVKRSVVAIPPVSVPKMSRLN